MFLYAFRCPLQKLLMSFYSQNNFEFWTFWMRRFRSGSVCSGEIWHLMFEKNRPISYFYLFCFLYGKCNFAPIMHLVACTVTILLQRSRVWILADSLIFVYKCMLRFKIEEKITLWSNWLNWTLLSQSKAISDLSSFFFFKGHIPKVMLPKYSRIANDAAPITLRKSFTEINERFPSSVPKAASTSSDLR